MGQNGTMVARYALSRSAIAPDRLCVANGWGSFASQHQDNVVNFQISVRVNILSRGVAIYVDSTPTNTYSLSRILEHNIDGDRIISPSRVIKNKHRKAESADPFTNSL